MCKPSAQIIYYKIRENSNWIFLNNGMRNGYQGVCSPSPFRHAITTLQSTARGTAFFNGGTPFGPENPNQGGVAAHIVVDFKN